MMCTPRASVQGHLWPCAKRRATRRRSCIHHVITILPCTLIFDASEQRRRRRDDDVCNCQARGLPNENAHPQPASDVVAKVLVRGERLPCFSVAVPHKLHNNFLKFSLIRCMRSSRNVEDIISNVCVCVRIVFIVNRRLLLVFKLQIFQHHQHVQRPFLNTHTTRLSTHAPTVAHVPCVCVS